MGSDSNKPHENPLPKTAPEIPAADIYASLACPEKCPGFDINFDDTEGGGIAGIFRVSASCS